MTFFWEPGHTIYLQAQVQVSQTFILLHNEIDYGIFGGVKPTLIEGKKLAFV